MATTVKEVKLQQNGSMISPVTMIGSVKNLSGTNLQTLLDAKASTSHTHSEYASSSHNHDGTYAKIASYKSKVTTPSSYTISALNKGEKCHYVIYNSGGSSINIKTPSTGTFYISGLLQSTNGATMFTDFVSKYAGANTNFTYVGSYYNFAFCIERLT